jgi:hypothetical protein
MTGRDESSSGTQPAPEIGDGPGRGSPGLQALAAILMVVVITVMVNYLSARHYARADWTAEKYFTLSEKTINVVKALQKPVEITVFMSAASALYADVKEILSRYRSHSTLIKVEYVDPDIDEARFMLLQKKYNIRSGTLPDGRQISEQVIVVASGDQVKFITPDDMTEFDFDSDPYASAPTMKSFKAEEQITSAILGITETESLKICFTTGHGEWNVERYDERGIGHLEELLQRDNYKIESIPLSDKKKVPDECRLLVIAGPERPFSESDADKVDVYFKGGGNLLVFLDPIVDGTKFVPTGLEKVLRRVGIDVRSAIVVESDESRLLPVSGVGMETFITKDYGEHPIVGPLEGIETLLRIALPLSASGAPSGKGAVPLLKTSEASWGETDLDDVATGQEPEMGDDDIPGPVTLGFAAQLPAFENKGPEGGEEEGMGGPDKEKKKPARGRIVVFGDSDMLHADLFGQLTLVNQEIVMGSMAWLTERPALISIAPKNPENVKLTLSDAQMKTVFFWIVVNMPVLAIILAVVVWWRRRK